MNKKTLDAVTKHGRDLLKAFPNAVEQNPVALCKKLRRIETSLAHPLTDYCNGTFRDDDEGTKMDALCEKAINKAVTLLGMTDGEQTTTGIHVNRDPRGYALKLSDDWRREVFDKRGINIYSDLGGYAILAPDLNQ